MSLYLQEQKLGSHSGPDSSSHKFMLKGRQTGGMHRGHGWVFRAETRETMLAWYNDIKNLTEKTGMERDAFVRRHARSISGGSVTARSASSDGGMEEDEADQVPYSASASQTEHPVQEQAPERLQLGGRFSSDVNVHRNLQVPRSPSSGTDSNDHDAIAAAGALPGSGVPFGASGRTVQEGEHGGLSNNFNDSRVESNLYGRDQTTSQPEQSTQATNATSHDSERAAAIDQATAAVAALAAVADPAAQTIHQKSELPRDDVSGLAYPQPSPPQNKTKPIPPKAAALGASPNPPPPTTTTFVTTNQYQSDGPAELSTTNSPPLAAPYSDQLQTSITTTAPAIAAGALPVAFASHHLAPEHLESHISGTETPATTMTGMTDSPPPSPTLQPIDSGMGRVGTMKPPLGRRGQSEMSVSELHVPGEYPKGR